MFTLNRQPPTCYQIIVSGFLRDKWSDWFNGLTIASESQPDGHAITVLTGPLRDQAALRGVLTKLWDLNLVLISVQQIPPSPDHQEQAKQ